MKRLELIQDFIFNLPGKGIKDIFSFQTSACAAGNTTHNWALDYAL